MIWGQVHPSEVIIGHWRSKTANWGHIGHNLQVTPRDAIFARNTQMTPRSSIGYVNLTSEVITDHAWSQLRDWWWSKIVNWGHILTAIFRNAIVYMYIHMTSRDISCNMSLTSKGHLWSLEVKQFKLRSYFDKNTQRCNFVHVCSYDHWQHNMTCEFDFRGH